MPLSVSGYVPKLRPHSLVMTEDRENFGGAIHILQGSYGVCPKNGYPVPAILYMPPPSRDGIGPYHPPYASITKRWNWFLPSSICLHHREMEFVPPILHMPPPPRDGIGPSHSPYASTTKRWNCPYHLLQLMKVIDGNVLPPFL